MLIRPRDSLGREGRARRPFLDPELNPVDRRGVMRTSFKTLVVSQPSIIEHPTSFVLKGTAV